MRRTRSRGCAARNTGRRSSASITSPATATWYAPVRRSKRMPNERTVLHALHAELGARFTAFAGYDMPIQYREGLRAEHLHTRAHAGLFDVSHMGQVRVTGPGVESALERALPLDFDDWPVGLQRYSLLMNERG